VTPHLSLNIRIVQLLVWGAAKLAICRRPMALSYFPKHHTLRNKMSTRGLELKTKRGAMCICSVTVELSRGQMTVLSITHRPRILARSAVVNARRKAQKRSGDNCQL